jgi:hypothetical protein
MPSNMPLLNYLVEAESQRASLSFELASMPLTPLGSSEPDIPEHEFLDSVISNGATFLSATGFTPVVTIRH